MSTYKPVDSDYLNTIGREPLLTAAEELELGHAIQAGAQPDAAPWLVRRAARARRRMILANMKLAATLAMRALPRTKSMEFRDLVQEACFGLNRAAEKFDPTRGYKFSTYAYRWIQQSLTRAIASQDDHVRIPIHTREMLHRFAKVTEEAIRHGEPLSMEEACSRASVVPHLFQSATAVSGVASLNHRKDDSETDLVDLLPAPEERSSYLSELGVDADDLLGLVNQLPPHQVAILRCAFGLDGAEEALQNEIGRRQGITRQAVADAKRKALNRLRRELLLRGVSP